MTLRQMTAWAVAAVVVSAAGPAFGQVVYEIRDNNGANPGGPFTVPVGGTLPLKIFLHDQGAGSPTLNQQGGLSAAAVRLLYTLADGVTNASAFAAVLNNATDVVAGPLWSFGTPGGGGVSASSVTLADAKTGAGVTADASGLILLGTFTLTGRSAGPVLLTARDKTPGLDETTYSNPPNTAIDSSIGNGTANLVVGAVPEPGTLALGGLAACGLAAIRRRRSAAAITA